MVIPTKGPSPELISRPRKNSRGLTILNAAQNLGILLILLSGCSTQQNSWSVQNNHASEPIYASSRLSFPSKDPTSGIDLEFIHYEGITELFLSIRSTPVPAQPGPSHETTLKIESDDLQLTTQILRHAGGQKFTVPPETQSLITSQLLKMQPVTLTLFEYRTTIEPAGFPDSYSLFTQSPSFDIPFRLPF